MLPGYALCQNFVEKSFQPNFSSTFGVVTRDSLDNFYLTGNSGFGIGAIAFFTKIDSSGTIIFNQPAFFTGENTKLIGIVESYDHNFIMCGQQEGCDFFPSQVGLITKYSANGNQLWVKLLNPDTSTSTADNFLINIIELPNNNLVANADSTLYYLNAFGDSLWSLVLPGRIGSLSSSGSDIIAGCDSQLLVIDTLGNFLNQFLFPDVIKYSQKISNSKYLIKAGNILYTLDSVFTIINQVNLTGTDFPADLITFDSGMICIGNTQGSIFAFLDHSLSLIDSFRIITAEVYCTSMALHDSTLFIFGNESAERYYHYFKSFKINGAYNYHNVDLALTNISFDTAFAYQPPHLPTGVFSIEFVPVLTVTNYGNETINSFNVNLEGLLPGPCGPNRRIQNFNGINILPGESLEVTLDTVVQYGIVLTPPYNFYYTFCPWISCPDSVADKDHSNDILCDSFLIDEIVFVHEISDKKISIYPNPVSDVLNVTTNISENRKVTYTILNSLNQVIDFGFLKSETINTSNLENGVYFLLVETEGGRWVNKFIKMKKN